MKITLIFLINAFVFCSDLSFGQDSTGSVTTKEYVMTLSRIAPMNFSFKYKRQLLEKIFLKVGLIDLEGTRITTIPARPDFFPTHYTTISAGIELGVEFRAALSEKLTFFHGPNIFFTDQILIQEIYNPALPSSSRIVITNNYIFGLPYTVGAMIRIHDHFSISGELNPGFRVSYKSGSSGNVITSNFSLTSSSGIMSLVYQR